MALNDISLTAGMRQNLVSLQGTVDLLTRTQTRLATGKKVNSALDNPTAFFAAQALDSRAGDIDALKADMGQAIQTISAADKGIKGITSLLEQGRGLAQQAQSVDPAGAEFTSLSDAYVSILEQIDNIAKDSGYKGINLLNSGTSSDLVVNFETGSLTVAAFDATSSGDLALTGGAWADAAAAATSVTEIADALTTLRSKSSAMSANLSIITTRQSFSTDMVNVLTEGSGKLTLADTNEEGANMLMLQTRQSLSTTALSLASQAAQSVLRLFG